MIAKQQFGFSKAEIINGLCEALVRNYLSNLARDKQLEDPVVFQGGVAANKGIIAAFERELQLRLIVPEHYSVMGAIGAACWRENRSLRQVCPQNFGVLTIER